MEGFRLSIGSVKLDINNHHSSDKKIAQWRDKIIYDYESLLEYELYDTLREAREKIPKQISLPEIILYELEEVIQTEHGEEYKMLENNVAIVLEALEILIKDIKKKRPFLGDIDDEMEAYTLENIFNSHHPFYFVAHFVYTKGKSKVKISHFNTSKVTPAFLFKHFGEDYLSVLRDIMEENGLVNGYEPSTYEANRVLIDAVFKKDDSSAYLRVIEDSEDGINDFLTNYDKDDEHELALFKYLKKKKRL